MRPRWARELLKDMRDENALRRSELERWRLEFEASRAEQRRRFDRIDAAMENDKRVTRQIVLELEEARERDRHARDQMRAMTVGLLRVLEELRRGDGPSAAGA